MCRRPYSTLQLYMSACRDFLSYTEQISLISCARVSRQLTSEESVPFAREIVGNYSCTQLAFGTPRRRRATVAIHHALLRAARGKINYLTDDASVDWKGFEGEKVLMIIIYFRV